MTYGPASVFVSLRAVTAFELLSVRWRRQIPDIPDAEVGCHKQEVRNYRKHILHLHKRVSPSAYQALVKLVCRSRLGNCHDRHARGVIHRLTLHAYYRYTFAYDTDELAFRGSRLTVAPQTAGDASGSRRARGIWLAEIC